MKIRLAIFFAIGMLCFVLPGAEEPVKGRETLPFNDPLIGYEIRELNGDLKSRIQLATAAAEKIETPKEKLIVLLKALRIPVESQVLVYSKTSTNGRLVSPTNPRAIYFDDEISVAWVPGANAFELAIHDPLVGEVFATVPNRKNQSSPWERQSRCLQCHVTGETLGVPGMLLKSVATDVEGKPTGTLFDHVNDSAWEHAWGGWFVSANREAFPTAATGLTPGDEPFSAETYPSRESDPVALLILRHQARVQNLLTRYRYEDALKRPLESEQPLVRAILCLDEMPFPKEIKRTAFAEIYEKEYLDGDVNQIGLRKLNLRDRLFEGRVSPLVCSRTIRDYPDDLRNRLIEALRVQCKNHRDPQVIDRVIRVLESWSESK